MKWLFFFLLISNTVNAQSDFTFPSLIVEYDSAIVSGHLKIIPIKRLEKADDSSVVNPSAISLKTGMGNGTVQIRERGNYMVDNINILVVENKSGKNLIIKSGEIVMGGRQDRVFAKDTILRSGKQHIIQVYCIEESRWSTAEKKFIYRGATGSGLQNIIDTSKNQTKVWDEIRLLLKQNNQTSATSYAVLLSIKKIKDTSNVYMQYFLKQLRMKDSSIVGIIASTGNKVLGADVFISTSLFYQTLPGLLEKYCAEAILSGSTASKNHEAERLYANELLSPQTQTMFLSKKGKRFFYAALLIQITGYGFVY